MTTTTAATQDLLPHAMNAMIVISLDVGMIYDIIKRNGKLSTVGLGLFLLSVYT